MATVVLLFGTLAILWRSAPVRNIVDALDRLSRGDLGVRVEPASDCGFQRISGAFNHLAERLRIGAEESRALTRKLIEVEDMERRRLARGLHDELGRTLTAIGALAVSIACGAPDGRPDIARDAGAIGANIASMMGCLRGVFAWLRPPDLEEAGPGASLRTMLSGWKAQRGATLIVDRDEGLVRDAVNLDLCRIVQECVTNAMRHG